MAIHGPLVPPSCQTRSRNRQIVADEFTGHGKGGQPEGFMCLQSGPAWRRTVSSWRLLARLLSMTGKKGLRRGSGKAGCGHGVAHHATKTDACPPSVRPLLPSPSPSPPLPVSSDRMKTPICPPLLRPRRIDRPPLGEPDRGIQALPERCSWHLPGIHERITLKFT